MGAGLRHGGVAYVNAARRRCASKAKDVSVAVARTLFDLPPGMCKSLTWDRGREMAVHAFLSALIDAPVYFCDPCIPWQRGTNENTNRILRQYLRRCVSLAAKSSDELEQIRWLLHARPHRVLDWSRAKLRVGLRHSTLPHTGYAIRTEEGDQR